MSKNYVKLYMYLKANNNAVNIIKSSKLKLTEGEKFNDPYDLTYVSNGKIKKVNGLYVICLTNSYKNRLMWAHYADKHMGICLTISLPKSIVYPICYTNFRPIKKADINKIFNKSKFKNCKKNVRENLKNLSYKKKLILIKDSKWKYESEYRVVIEKGTNDNVFIVNKNSINCIVSNVYIGVNMDKRSSIYKKLKKECQNKKIQITETKLNNKSYGLRFVKNELYN